jgi:TolB protein
MRPRCGSAVARSRSGPGVGLVAAALVVSLACHGRPTTRGRPRGGEANSDAGGPAGAAAENAGRASGAIADLPCRQRVGDELCELALSGAGSYQNPAWSPDSRHLLVTHFGRGYNAGTPTLEVIDLVTGRVTVIGSGVNLPGNSNSWSAANRITFAHEPVGPYNVLADEQGPYSVTGEQAYVVDPFGDRTPSPITWYQGGGWEPSLSPPDRWTSGTWVVFQDRGDRRIVITAVYPDFRVRRAQRYLDITDGRLARVKQPVWGPDGRHIVYQGQAVAGGPWRLQLVQVPRDPLELDGAGDRFTRPLPFDGTDPSFGPDGRWLVYSGPDDRLRAAPLPTEAQAEAPPLRVTRRSGGYEGAPGWSPSGSLIAFEASEGNPEAGRTALWITRAPAPEGPQDRVLAHDREDSAASQSTADPRQMSPTTR